MSPTPSQREYLILGHNGLETCVILSEAAPLCKRRFMERETVKDLPRRFNEGGVHYCLSANWLLPTIQSLGLHKTWMYSYCPKTSR